MRNIIVAVALFYGVSLHSQEIAFYPLGPVIVGATICTEKNEPLILVNSIAEGETALLAEVLAHEMVHVRQLHAYPGGCKAAQARYQVDPQFRFDVEFEAYCANAVRDMTVRGMPLGDATLNLVENVAQYPSSLSEAGRIVKAANCIRSHYAPGMRLTFR